MTALHLKYRVLSFYRFIRDISISGFVICKCPLLCSYKERLLRTCYSEGERHTIDRILFWPVFRYWVRFEYLKETNPDKREAMKEIAMGGRSGKAWAQAYDDQPLSFDGLVGALTFKEAIPLFDMLEQTCRVSSEPLIVIQIGSSSGREISWLAKKHPRHTCIGTDIYDEVIEYSANHHRATNLTFIKCSARNISNLLEPYLKKPIVIFSSGSLQYVQPEHLSLFFNAVAQSASAKVIISEPGDDGLGDPTELRGSCWRGTFGWTHNYKFYAEASGLRTLECKLIHPYIPAKKFPGHHHTILYSYTGESRALWTNPH